MSKKVNCIVLLFVVTLVFLGCNKNDTKGGKSGNQKQSAEYRLEAKKYLSLSSFCELKVDAEIKVIKEKYDEEKRHLYYEEPTSEEIAENVKLCEGSYKYEITDAMREGLFDDVKQYFQYVIDFCGLPYDEGQTAKQWEICVDGGKLELSMLCKYMEVQEAATGGSYDWIGGQSCMDIPDYISKTYGEDYKCMAYRYLTQVQVYCNDSMSDKLKGQEFYECFQDKVNDTISEIESNIQANKEYEEFPDCDSMYCETPEPPAALCVQWRE